MEAFLAAYDPNGAWGTEQARPGRWKTTACFRATPSRRASGSRSAPTPRSSGSARRPRSAAPGWTSAAPRTVNATNIIIRNITFYDTYDCFPEWSPTDGTLGSWNALYDSISLRNADHVWVDHNTFRDKETLDEDAPIYFGVLFQRHDGLLDITNASDLVTVSWNRFLNHDKIMLIGSSDSASADRGKLRVTIHHNLFDNIGQRAPRVRFGQVHIYNNYYKIEKVPYYVYTWGVGIESAIYAENNFFKTDKSITPGHVHRRVQGDGDPRIRNLRQRHSGQEPGRHPRRLERGKRPGPLAGRRLGADTVPRNPTHGQGAIRRTERRGAVQLVKKRQRRVGNKENHG